MTAKQGRGALEDLEAMLDRSLKIEASPPRWQNNYQHPAGNGAYQTPVGNSPHSSPTNNTSARPTSVVASPSSSGVNSPYQSGNMPLYTTGTVQPHAVNSSTQPPSRVFPQRVPVNSQTNASPKALYQRSAAKETQAVPSPMATRGMRPSASQHSISTTASTLDPREQKHEAAAHAEAQRQQHIQRMQQLEQQRIEQQRLDRLEALTEQQRQQELELDILRQRQQQQQQHQWKRDQAYQQLQQDEEALVRRAQELSLREAQFRDAQIKEAQILESRARQESLRDAQMREAKIREAQNRESELRQARIRELEARQLEARQLEARQLEARQLEIRQREAERVQKEAQAKEAQAKQAQAKEAQSKDAQNREALAREYREAKLKEAKARETQAEREGAATMVQKTQDANGNVTTRVVKKGVEDFDFKDELGAGSYSTVVAAQDKQTLRKYAIKVLDKAHIIKEQKVKYVEIEKNTLNRLGDHPGVIKLYFTFQDRQSLYFVLDFAPNGELLHLIKRIGSLNEESARYYACQLLDAIEYMHDKGVIHRDLKPENILLDYKMRIKITDFGTAKLLPYDAEKNRYPSDCRANSFVGTAEYVTPELLVDKTQGKSADIWAWGCVLYQMIAASPPFQGNTQYLTFQKIARLQYSIPPGFPYVVRELLKHVLVKAPHRWSINQIKTHEFFEGQDWSRKALWNMPPPRLQPYKATVASMKPRALGGRPPQRPTKLPQLRPPSSSTGAAPSQGGSNHAANSNNSYAPGASNSGNNSSGTNNGNYASGAAANSSQKVKQQVFVPTSAGLQPLNPSTLYGMPLNLNKDSSTASSSTSSLTGSAQVSSTSVESRKLNAARSKRSPNQSASAATSALYKTPQSTSTAYQQSQERISALKRRMQEQRQNGRPASSGVGNGSSAGSGVGNTGTRNTPSTHRSSSGSKPAGPNSAGASPAMPSSSSAGAASQTVGSPSPSDSPASPVLSVSPPLPLPPLTQVESQWSQILVSAQERILQMGHMRVYASTHPPPQAIKPPSGKSGDNKDSKDDDTVTYSQEDDSLFTKFFHSKNKPKLVIVTTHGRLLVMADDRKVQYEVPVGVPQVDVQDVPFQTSTGRVNRIVIQMHSRVLTLDDPGKISSWINSIELSRRYYAQLTADQERNTYNAAAAAAFAVSTRRKY